jgi:DNA-binding NarL/FixJ family response regulator
VRRAGASAGAPLRVLIVDDHPGFRWAARELLEARGYAVAGEASCAVGALEAAERLEPDAVLLDVRLGDESGLQVARALTRLDPAPAVLLVSATDHADGDEHAQACGARGFLLKCQLAVTDLTRYWSPLPLAGDFAPPGR